MTQIMYSKMSACCIFALLIATFGYGQNPPANTSPSTNSPTTRTNSTPSPFLNQVIEINHAEVELGHLASSKAADKRVKTFADMMVKDHSAGLKKLQKVAEGQA